MILKKNIINLIIFINLIFFSFLFSNLKANEVIILFKINEKIATNIDVENEFNYLTSLNPKLKDIDESQVLEFAKNSLIKEIVKKFEISKYYELNKKNNLTEFYNLIYQYQNDCLIASLRYNKEYYTNSSLEPNEELFFNITLIPLGSTQTDSVLD